MAAWIFRAPLLTGVGSLLVEDDGVQKAQAIVVLGGDDNGMRLLKAAQLAQAGYAPYVIVDSPKRLIGYESDATIQYAVQEGYPQALFHPLPLPQGVQSTWAEAGFVGTNLRERHLGKILLVTSNYHTHRAAHLFRERNPGLQVIAVPAPDPDFTPATWWKSREGQKTFLLEWMKTVASWLKI